MFADFHVPWLLILKIKIMETCNSILEGTDSDLQRD